MSRLKIFDEINLEREYQDNKWGGEDVDDRENGPMEWTGYIAKYSSKWFPGGFPPHSFETMKTFRNSMIKVASLAVAAIEQCDRHFDEGGFKNSSANHEGRGKAA